MKISLIHPSRGRAEMAAKTFFNWTEKRSGKHEIEHILSLDKDDKELPKYLDRFIAPLINDNTCVVEAANKGAEKATGDILIYLSDDFDCPQNWDELICKVMEKRISWGNDYSTKPETYRAWLMPTLLRVNDGFQPMENCVLTIPIMSKSLYEQLGYFWHPEYKSMWVDVDLYFTTKPYMIEAPELLFPHNHPACGKGEEDETYQRSNNNWNQGVEIFNRRSREFGWGRAFNKIPA